MINFPYPKIREKRNAKEPNKIEKKNNKIKITIKQEKKKKKSKKSYTFTRTFKRIEGEN